MTGQLTFDLPPKKTFTRSDFFPADSNSEAMSQLADWPNWPNGKLILIGPEGAGKSHLAHIWAAEAGAVLLQVDDLETLDLGADWSAVVVDDAHRVAGNPAQEEALFHLHNRVLPAGRLLLTANTPPRDWGLRLPDLQSRMQAAAIARLHAPDDALLAAVLVKLFADRQITVPPNLIPYLTLRIDRSIAAAQAIVETLDARALQLARPVTRALAAEVLDTPQAE